MTLYHGYDASVPPAKPFPGSEIVCGYIGGDTPHVWTADEWNAASNNGSIRMLPIYVVSNPAGHNFRADAKQAADLAHALGWARHIGRAIVLDSETSADVDYIHGFAEHLRFDGFETIDYRSISALISHPSGLMEWAADYSLPTMPSSSRQNGFQYATEIAWESTKLDVSIFDDVAYSHAGRGKRK